MAVMYRKNTSWDILIIKCDEDVIKQEIDNYFEIRFPDHTIDIVDMEFHYIEGTISMVKAIVKYAVIK